MSSARSALQPPPTNRGIGGVFAIGIVLSAMLTGCANRTTEFGTTRVDCDNERSMVTWWLPRHQAADGHWGSGVQMAGRDAGVPCEMDGETNDDGISTALASLALGSAGLRNQSVDRKTEGWKDYAAAGDRSCDWLRRRQRADGLLSGLDEPRFRLTHIVATTALLRHYRLREGFSGRSEFRASIQSALDVLSNASVDWPWSLGRASIADDGLVTAWALSLMRELREGPVPIAIRTNDHVFRLDDSIYQRIASANFAVAKIGLSQFVTWKTQYVRSLPASVSCAMMAAIRYPDEGKQELESLEVTDVRVKRFVNLYVPSRGELDADVDLMVLYFLVARLRYCQSTPLANAWRASWLHICDIPTWKGCEAGSIQGSHAASSGGGRVAATALHYILTPLFF